LVELRDLSGESSSVALDAGGHRGLALRLRRRANGHLASELVSGRPGRRRLALAHPSNVSNRARQRRRRTLAFFDRGYGCLRNDFLCAARYQEARHGIEKQRQNDQMDCRRSKRRPEQRAAAPI
jgi:hypothetical protein